jgi:hypothetical protein
LSKSSYPTNKAKLGFQTGKMKRLILLLSICVISSESWSNCVGDCVTGYGIYTSQNGDKYSGQWKGGTWSGYGTLTLISGNGYFGQFEDGKFNGTGTYTWPDGRKYIGQFKDDLFNGQGTYTWPNGEKYVGRFEGGDFNGQGTYTWPDGEKYVGRFEGGDFNGQGTFTRPNGEKHVGQFKDDLANGPGVTTYEDGRRYVGQFKNGNVIPGQGVEYLPDGRQLIFEGEVKLHASNGKVLRTNVPENELDAIRLESVANKRRDDELLAKEQRQNKILILGIQKHLIENQYLSGVADGISGKNTSIALAKFYQDTQVTRPSLDDYSTITDDLKSAFLSANGSCSNNSASQSKYTVCFNNVKKISVTSQEDLKRSTLEQQRIEKEAAEQLAAEKSIRVAAVTCAVIRETRQMDSAIRVREVNNARESIGALPYTLGDEIIVDAVKYGLCKDLVLDDNFVTKLKSAHEVEKALKAERDRMAREKRAAEERIAAEKRAEKRAEKVRVAAEKRAEEETIAEERREEARRIISDLMTGDFIDFHGVKLDLNYYIVELDKNQQGRNMEVGDKLLEIRSTPIDFLLIAHYVTRDFSDDPSSLLVTLERNGERKTRSIGIR